MKCIGQNASDQVIPHFRSPWAQCLMCLVDNSALERANTCFQFNVYYLGRYIICWLKTITLRTKNHNLSHMNTTHTVVKFKCAKFVPISMSKCEKSGNRAF